MKIAYVITRADAVGGASVHVRDVARAMLERGHEACVFLGGEGPVSEQLRRAGVPYVSLRLLQRAIHPARDIDAYAELKSALRAFAPELVSTHTAKAGWIGRAAARALRIPSIYTPHGWSISDRISKTLGMAYTVAERIAAPWCNAIVCVCEAERRLALDKRVGSPEQLRVIYNAVRDNDLRADPARSPVRIVSVARFEAPKDHGTLLDALAQCTGWTLELVGDGPLEAQLRSRAQALGIVDRVVFTGYLADPAETLARAQMFVLSSRSEGFPRSILEAMRTGLPVVASDVGGIREAVSDGVVPAGDARALARAIQSLIDAPEERRRQGMEARSRYEARFRLERMVDETEALYARVLA